MYNLDSFAQYVTIETENNTYEAEVVGEFKVGRINYLELDVKGVEGYLATDGELIGRIDAFDFDDSDLEEIIDVNNQNDYESHVEFQIDLARDARVW